MSQPQTPKPAKLLIGFFLKEKDLVDAVVKSLTKTFGPVDMLSSWFPFNFTTYYEPEMGKPLFRRMVAFEALIKQSALPDIKRITNDLERAYLKNGKRMVNVDPGYLLRERLVLATGKNYSHRIYIGQQIYADLTLIYTKGRFMKLPWTYPDYAEPSMLIFLERVRNKYVSDLKRTYV